MNGKQKLWLMVNFVGVSSMSVLMFSLLLQSDCTSGSLCLGMPDVFKHSLEYDILFLRAGAHATLFQSHLSSELLIPALFFPLFFMLKDSISAILITGFFLFWHEAIWSSFEYAFNLGLGASELSWTLVLFGGCAFCVWVLPEIFWKGQQKWYFLISTIPILEYLFAWKYFDNLNVSVSGHVLTSQYYNVLTNSLEVGAWVVVYAQILVFVALFLRTHKYLLPQIQILQLK